MALVLPTVHDPDGSGITAPSGSWSYLSGPSAPEDLNLQRDRVKRVILHNGQPITVGQQPNANYWEQYPKVLRLNSSDTWTSLGDFSNLIPDSNWINQSFDIYSFDGELYAAFGLQNTISPAGSRPAPRVYFYKWNESTSSWTHLSAPNGIESPSGTKDIVTSQQGSFFVLNGNLFLLHSERYQESFTFYTRLVVFKLSGSTWSRVASLAPGPTAIDRTYRPVVSGSTLWFMVGSSSASLYRYTEADGIILKANQSDWRGSGSRTPITYLSHLFVSNGDPHIAFQWSQTDNDLRTNYYISTASTLDNANVYSSGAWSRTQYTKPMAGTKTSMKAYARSGSTEYMLIDGQGTGQTGSQNGTWLYKNTGSGWTQLGGGSFLSQSLNGNFSSSWSDNLTPGTQDIFVLGGVPHVVMNDYPTSATTDRIGSNYELVIAKTAA